MSNYTRCDRCGSFVKGGPFSDNTVRLTREGFLVEFNYDICQPCFRDFMKFMNELGIEHKEDDGE